MTARERKYAHKDRVRHADGRTGTVIDVHADGKPNVRLGVLFDDGPQMLVVVDVTDVRRI